MGLWGPGQKLMPALGKTIQEALVLWAKIIRYMKHKMTIIAVVLSLIFSFSVCAGGPHLTLSPSDVVDFGKFEPRHVQKKVVYVKNTGDEPLEILKSFRGCSCTSLEYSHEPIAPGDSVPVTITLDARSRKPGLIRKSIRVTSNADNRVMAIFIRGEVSRPFRADD